METNGSRSRQLAKTAIAHGIALLIVLVWSMAALSGLIVSVANILLSAVAVILVVWLLIE